MNNEQEVLIQLNNHENALKELKCNIIEIKDKQSKMDELIQSVNKLAFNMEHMTEEQKRQRDSLERLEQAPIESLKLYKRQVVNAIISALAGILVGAIVAAIIQAIK